MKTKGDIVNQIAASTDLSTLQVQDVVQRTFDTIVDAIVEHGRIELRNFGVFEVKVRKARMARNPKTGAIVHVPEKRVVSFRAGKIVNDRLEEATSDS